MQPTKEQFFRTDFWLRVVMGVVFVGFAGWMTATWATADENKERITRLEGRVEAAQKEAERAKDAAKEARSAAKEAADKAQEATEQAVANGTMLQILLERKDGDRR